MNILVIDSSARVAQSDSRKLGERLVNHFGTIPGTTLVRRDLNQGLHLLSEQHLAAYNTHANTRTAQQNKLLETSNILIAELRACDRLIITTPMYNYNIPSSLKMWQDLVMRENETFKTIPTGVEGLLKGKKAYVIITTGGVSHNSADHLLQRLIELFLTGIGITDQTFIHADNLAYDRENSLARANSQIDELEISS